jgi:hypothetical protein
MPPDYAEAAVFNVDLSMVVLSAPLCFHLSMAKFDYPFTRYASYDREAVAAALEPDYHFQPQVGSWGISGIVRSYKPAYLCPCLMIRRRLIHRNPLAFQS